MNVYLSGPIDGRTDQECRVWREYVKLKLPNSIDPMRRNYRGREVLCTNEIVEFDKIDIAKCDVLLVNYDRPSVGTSMEILYAWERGKFVIVVNKDNTTLSPWIQYHSHVIVASLDEAIAKINNLYFLS